jgi:hypothetical protein
MSGVLVPSCTGALPAVWSEVAGALCRHTYFLDLLQPRRPVVRVPEGGMQEGLLLHECIKARVAQSTFLFLLPS